MLFRSACLRSPHEQGQAHRDSRGLAGIVRRGDSLPGRGRAYFRLMTMITSGGERVAAVMPRPWRSRAVFRDWVFPKAQGASFLSYIVQATKPTLSSISSGNSFSIPIESTGWNKYSWRRCKVGKVLAVVRSSGGSRRRGLWRKR